MNTETAIQFDTTDVLIRIIAPFGAALIALTQFPGTPVGNWFLVAVLVAGIAIAFNQTVELFDRRYNPELHHEGGCE